MIRSHGVTPATIGVVKGSPVVGLSEDELSFLASPKEKTFKLSTRDLPTALFSRKSGGTTVSATSFLAHKAGIRLFATGGIGGVHRGWQETFDISGDLTQLSMTPITIVSSGVKSILDVASTLEYLETVGVTVVTYDDGNYPKSDHQEIPFPAFFSRLSAATSPASVSSPQEAARVVLSRDELGLHSAILIANPIPKEDELLEISGVGDIHNIINQAVEEAKMQGVTGKEVTPFLLSRVKEKTGNLSLTANISLVKNNAALAAKIALQLADPRGFGSHNGVYMILK